MNHLLSTIDITQGGKIKFEDIIVKIKGNIFIVSVDSDFFLQIIKETHFIKPVE